jgi:adenosylcobinamide-GDP ribazoletransferase
VATHFIAIDMEPGRLLSTFAGAIVASGLAFLVMWRWFWRRLQGFTGDCLGATQQLCELAFYLGLALCL